MIRRASVVVLVGLLVSASAFSLRSAWEDFRAEGSQPAYAQSETGTCPDAQLIDTFEGSGDQQSDTFDTTTNSLRITYTTENTIGSGLEGSLFVDVIDANDPDAFPVGSISEQGSSDGETFVNAPPGTYYLDIIAGGLDYNITVEQCEGGAPSSNPGGGTETPDPESSDPAPSATVQYDNGDGDLLEAGGPIVGPMPLMPDGSCPKEFPVKSGSVCKAE